MRAITSFGFASQSRSGAEVPPLERARAEVLGQDVAVLDELEQQLLAPLASRRLSVTHFLFRDWTGHQSERPS